MGPNDKSVNGKIGFPVTCEYRGGNPGLGRHGRHLWIEDGKIGHGELSLTHSIPLVRAGVRRHRGSDTDGIRRTTGGHEACIKTKASH